MKRIKLAYIGGGSKEWAHVFMNDLALSEGITGEIALYDIDLLAASEPGDRRFAVRTSGSENEMGVPGL